MFLTPLLLGPFAGRDQIHGHLHRLLATRLAQWLGPDCNFDRLQIASLIQILPGCASPGQTVHHGPSRPGIVPAYLSGQPDWPARPQALGWNVLQGRDFPHLGLMPQTGFHRRAAAQDGKEALDQTKPQTGRHLPLRSRQQA